MKPFSTLFTKILLWFFLNLALVGLVLGIIFAAQSQIDLESFLGRQAKDRMRIAGNLISRELGQTPFKQWSDILLRYSEIYQIDFILALNPEQILTPKNISVPSKVMAVIENMRVFRDRSKKNFRQQNPTKKLAGADNFDSNRRFSPRLMVRTQDPTKYWAGIIIPVYLKHHGPPKPALLLAVSESITGKGFFFDPLPWISATILVITLSVIFWIPFVRHITKPLERMTQATEKIAMGRFDVKIYEPGTDEIGRLGKAINHMTARLAGYVNGQKRFLGDVAHELGSPIARIQLGIAILEQTVDKNNRERLKDVSDDVSHMSSLVNELLSFSRAGMLPKEVKLLKANLFEIVQKAVERENHEDIKISIDVPRDMTVYTASELLIRALANLIRNAVKYAGHLGPVKISAQKKPNETMIQVIDSGPGVADEFLDKLFEPFFRTEPSRKRESGGVGLGMAIVKTCVEACKGTVAAKNLKPKGFAITIILPD
ncbi:MAG: HAMP domain-containing sensor histidine kinase [Desulfobacterales bacterium]